jgi:peptidoglycan/LPS O-acetylase OafA/YrhL
MMMRAMWIARRRGQTDWAALFLFIACYAMAIVINATFDVTLEAPMQGVWFWCLIGLGIGSVMVYRAQHHEPV